MWFNRRKRVLQMIDEIVSVFTPEELAVLKTGKPFYMDFKTLLTKAFQNSWPLCSREESREIAQWWRDMLQDDLRRGAKLHVFFLGVFKNNLFT